MPQIQDVNWGTGVITVQQSGLVLVSGTLYDMDTNAFRLELKALEASVDGMTFGDTHIHNTQVTVAGTTFARTVEIVTPYSVRFLPDTLWTVRLQGSNNNIFDVENGILVQNSVQVIPGNSAGLIVNQGQALGAQDLLDIAAAVWNHIKGLTLAKWLGLR